MKNFFRMDSKFFIFMGDVADIIILNLLFLITSLPLITIGTSLTALYSVTLKQSDGTSAYVVREYFHSWKVNFRQSTVFWLFSLLVYTLLLLNLSLKVTGNFSWIIHLIMIITLILYSMLSLYTFPLLAKFDNTLKHTIVNAFFLSIRHFGTTCILFGTIFFFILITTYLPMVFEPLMVSWMLFLIALITRIQSVFLCRIFHQYLSQADI